MRSEFIEEMDAAKREAECLAFDCRSLAQNAFLILGKTFLVTCIDDIGDRLEKLAKEIGRIEDAEFGVMREKAMEMQRSFHQSIADMVNGIADGEDIQTAILKHALPK